MTLQYDRRRGELNVTFLNAPGVTPVQISLIKRLDNLRDVIVEISRLPNH
jgi:hypothetical protein